MKNHLWDDFNSIELKISPASDLRENMEDKNETKE